MELPQVHFKDIESCIEHWDTQQDFVANTLISTQQKFAQWSTINATQFKAVIQPTNIQKILNQENSPPNLFTQPTSNTKDLQLEILIEKWEAKDALLEINYSIENSLFGKLLIASTLKGICWMGFITSVTKSTEALYAHFPEATVVKNEHCDFHAKLVNQLFCKETTLKRVCIHSKGSEFQYKVWEALLKIKEGELVTYGALAKSLGLPLGASRAVGTAIGKNHIALLIPCHRVVRQSGVIGAFRWGSSRKKALIGWEVLNC